MKVLIDTSNPDLFLSLIDGDKTLSYIHIKDLVKKADELPSQYNQMLSNANVKTSQVKEFYITTGPGSFMGSRSALVFAKTICQITNAKLFTANTFEFISASKDGVYFIDAKGNSFYKAFISSGEIEMSLVNEGVATKINYEDIIENPSKYLSAFSRENNILEAKPVYLKDPKVGGE